MNKGRLVIFEGPDGVGKTTLANALVERWTTQGRKCLYYAFPGHQTGTLGELVYRVHHDDPRLGVTSVSPASLQLLHIAAHIDAIERFLLPAIQNGTDVVLDRFWWSTWVYGVNQGVSTEVLDSMIHVETLYWGSHKPAAVFLVSRTEPLRVETDPQSWQDLCERYRVIARKQSKHFPVFTLFNENAVDDALLRIVQSLEETNAAYD